MVFRKRSSLCSCSNSFILIVNEVTSCAIKVPTCFQLTNRSKLGRLFASSTHIILVIVCVSIEFPLGDNHIVRQLYFLCPLPLPSIQVILNITGMRLEGIFTELNLTFWNKFLCWPSYPFFDIFFCIYWLACEFVLWHDKVLLNHFILSFGVVVLILRIILIIWAIEVAMLNRLWTFMLSYIKTIIPQLHASHTHLPCAVWTC